MKNSIQINELNNYLNTLLQPERFSDYCPNGLQVEGKQHISTIVTGVTASMALLEAAFQINADVVLVHHGYFWRGEAQAIVGIKKRRIQFLLQHDINLFAYHLPLDAHAELGNNVMLAKQLGLNITGKTGEKEMVLLAELTVPQSLQTFAKLIEGKLNRVPQVIGDMHKPIKQVALCTGAAQGYIEQALAENVDAYISGEISEQTVHVARESGMSYISAGHHATERYGIQALGEHLAQKFNLQHIFVDCDNPV